MVKLEQKHLNVFNALLEHGSYTKKYKYKNNFFYSEHLGGFDFDKHG